MGRSYLGQVNAQGKFKINFSNDDLTINHASGWRKGGGSSEECCTYIACLVPEKLYSISASIAKRRSVSSYSKEKSQQDSSSSRTLLISIAVEKSQLDSSTLPHLSRCSNNY